MAGIWADMEPTAQRIEEVVTKIADWVAIEARFFCYPGWSLCRITDHVQTHDIGRIVFAEPVSGAWWQLSAKWSHEICAKHLRKAMPTMPLSAVRLSERTLRDIA